MSLGTIIYYILWPAIILFVLIVLCVDLTSQFLKFLKDLVEDMHDEIKKL